MSQYERALLYDPDSPYLAVELAASYLQMNDMGKAIEVLERSLNLNPKYIDSHLLLGAIYERINEREKAIGHYRFVIGLEPDMPDPYLMLGTLYKYSKDYEMAISTMEDLLNRDFENHMASYQLAHMYMETGRLDEAKYWLRRTMAIAPNFESPIADLALIHELEKEEEEAISLYREYLKYNPQDINVRLRLGRLLLQEGDYKEAAGELEEILDYDASSSEARFSLGVAYLFGKINYEKAVEIFLSLLKENPANDRIRYFLASSYQENGDSEEALRHFGDVSAISDLFTPSRIQMSLIMNGEGRTAEAVDLINQAIAVTEKDPDLYSLLASIYEESGETDRAEDVLSDAINLLPSNMEIRYRLGLIYERAGKHEEAIDTMMEILELDPENAEAMNFVGYSYADRGINLEKAEAMIIEAMRLKPGSGHITDSLGWVYFRQGRIAEAIQYLEEAHRLLPDDPIISDHLGDAYSEGGMIEKAIELYKKTLKNNPDDAMILEKLQNLQKRGNPQIKIQ